MPGSVAVRSRTCASELPQDYKSDTLPLDYRATKCFNIADYGTLPIGASGGQSAKCYQRIVDACDAVVILLGDHKRRQVGRVTGRKVVAKVFVVVAVVVVVVVVVVCNWP